MKYLNELRGIRRYSRLSEIILEIGYESLNNISRRVIISLLLLLGVYVIVDYGYPGLVYLGSLINMQPVYMGLLLSVIIAPFVEELFKHIAIRYKSIGIYGALFILIELLLYLIWITVAGTDLCTALIMRSGAIILHILTILIQKKHYDEGTPLIGFQFAYIMHVLFNWAASW